MKKKFRYDFHYRNHKAVTIILMISLDDYSQNKRNPFIHISLCKLLPKLIAHYWYFTSRQSSTIISGDANCAISLLPKLTLC